MYEIAPFIFTIAILASCYLGWDAFKHRFLPVAQPLMFFSIILVLPCLIYLVDLMGINFSQPVAQAILDFRLYVVRPLAVFFWVWTFLEYYQDKKIPFTHKFILLLAIHPFLVAAFAAIDIIANGFINQTPDNTLITPQERLGSSLPVFRAYGMMIAIGLVCFTPNLVKKRHLSQHRWLETMFMMLLTTIPFTLYLMHINEYTKVDFSSSVMVLFLYWASRQYRLLDALPIAMQSIMDKVDAGILVSNLQSKLLYVNDYTKKLFRFEATPTMLQRRDFPIPATFTQHFDFSKPEKQTALLHTKNDQGDIRYIDATLQPLFHPKFNKHLGSTLSLHDITERKQAELELQNLNRQKSEFFAGISHEFRTPLTLSLGSIADVLNESDKIEAPQRQALLQAKHNNKRLLGLVNQLLELSRLDKGSLSIRPAKIRLDHYVPMLIANFESLAEKQNIRLHFSVSDEAQQDSTVYFDPDALDKILINLISNALKSIDDENGGEVNVKLSQTTNKQLRLTVRDTGCGIPPQALPKIFEMFYSHQMNNPAWPPGTGVGLSLVKQLLLQHSGDISVSSTQGEGSCFTVDLQRGYTHFAEGTPIDHGHEWGRTQDDFVSKSPSEVITTEPDSSTAPDNSETDGHTRSVAGNHKRVLLAEDNPDMRRYIRKHLSDFAPLLEAPDGAAALALARQEMPDLILSDVMMPKMNGYDLCKQLKSDTQTSHIPVVLLTAKSDQSEKLEGLSLGADDYLSKPFDIRELNLRIHNLIKARQTIHTFYQTNGMEQVISHPELPKRETVFLETLRNYVLENIEDTDIRTAHLAETVHMSERSLSRKLKALTGETPKKMLLTIRLEQAAKLLTESEDNITNLSYQTGFSDPSYFARSFKTHYGMTPTEYRERQ